jgi:hypothetical protein
MAAHQLEQCFHIDSDVMIYVDLTEDCRKFEQFELTLVNKGCAHSSFIRYEGIRKICQFIMDTYTQPSQFAELEREQALRQAERQTLPLGQLGGISDMSLLRQFGRLHADIVGSASEIIDDSVYDFKVDAANGFEMHRGVKKIKWVNRQPFGRQIASDRQIKFNSLHFQGRTKRYIYRYFTGNLGQTLYYIMKGFGYQIRRKFLPLGQVPLLPMV